ncbi:hypothetical protein C7H09_11650 [Marinobacter fuscus]|uniref:Uncharacterized protein n=1 Tax=Marinobacter fuscus TaxID=2109942 RepID=A0A2T1K7F6_9GAMM|nr:hypothetical protein [Marinobacter fuscus]PSF05990.1 hypothetical protein C7H09_11650 [Marinobacter fuscus]
MIPLSSRFAFEMWWFLAALILLFSLYDDAQANKGISENLAPELIRYSKASLNLSLCAVVFEEEVRDFEGAERYGAGVVHTERLIRQGSWTDKEVLSASVSAMEQDYSFRLTPEKTWADFRREKFTREFCDNVLDELPGQSD